MTGPAVEQRRPVVVGVFQQSSMKGRGTVGWRAGATVALPLRTQPDHQMVVVRA